MRRLRGYKTDQIFFFDIETVSQYHAFDEVSDTAKLLWEGKYGKLRPDDITEADYYFEKSGLYAEFGKIVCISVGFLDAEGKELAVKSFSGNDEKQILTEFAELLEKYKSSKPILCGHNIKEFDIPYSCRRMLINGIALPELLDVGGLKPWEILHIDTMELWKFGDYKNFTSLKLIAEVLGVSSPKDDIDGSEVNGVYWNESDVPRISSYCQKDVICVAQLFLRLSGKPHVDEVNIRINTEKLKNQTK